ncbi:MAG: VOC family protein [Armatimonadetes bacterium]|nr:VOC family protein [Armatimonadota bacterium]
MPNFEFEGGMTAAYEVSDVSKSIAWYQDVMGFTLQYHLEEMGWCEMASSVPRVNVGLSQVEKPKVEGGPTLTWGVKDIDAARSELESKGVKFDGETTEIPDMVKLATFFDPDGNHLMLYQDLSK